MKRRRRRTTERKEEVVEWSGVEENEAEGRWKERATE
jgi:hypothetical protein